MNGWKYDWVDELPRAVYDVLVDELNNAKQPPEPDDHADDQDA